MIAANVLFLKPIRMDDFIDAGRKTKAVIFRCNIKVHTAN